MAFSSQFLLYIIFFYYLCNVNIFLDIKMLKQSLFSWMVCNKKMPYILRGG